MEWSTAEVPAVTDADRAKTNWLNFDGTFIRIAAMVSLTVSAGWALTVALLLGDFQRTMLGTAAEEVGKATMTSELVFFAVPLYGLWFANRLRRDNDDVLAIFALAPLHLLAIPTTAMIALSATGVVMAVLAIGSLLGNVAYIVLLWIERQVWIVG